MSNIFLLLINHVIYIYIYIKLFINIYKIHKLFIAIFITERVTTLNNISDSIIIKKLGCQDVLVITTPANVYKS